MDLGLPLIVATTAGLTVCFTILILICLKIKSTKKNPELLGIVGTVKPLGETDDNQQTQQPNSFVSKASPRLRPVSTISDVIHDITDNGINCRTPSRAGERKLPDIPHDLNGSRHGDSELYATLGSALAEGGSDSEEAETEPTETNHPYAKVKKKRKNDHPYATLQQSNSDNVGNSVGGASAHQAPPPRPPPASEPLVDSRPQPPINNQNQPQYFSGDSQDSSKGYTSISVREPLRHIRGHGHPQPPPLPMNSNYAPVSETSDDMYAAIEDPTYLPTGNQSNSDTYAVINLPEDEDEVALGIDHPYSQVDKSRKRKAISQPPMSQNSKHNNNVDEMYAKVQKNVPNGAAAGSSKEPGYVDKLPLGASAMRTSAEQLLGARPRYAPHHHHHSRHINYSDYEVAHYDPTNKPKKPPAPDPEEGLGGYETVPETRSFLTNDHEGYERVEDYWRNQNDVEAGYELVRENSKRKGFERLTFSNSSTSKKTDPGYETVPPRPPLPRMNYHHPRGGHPAPPGARIDPPYARLENANEEESEEGYETIPASEQRGLNKFDPGYESVPGDKKDSEAGYETVPNRDPGYETVRPQKDPGYATVSEKKPVNHGYENIDNKKDTSNSLTIIESSEDSNLVHLNVRKTHSDPPLLPRGIAPPRTPNLTPILTPRNTASSVVVIEHTTKLAVNNNIGELGTASEVPEAEKVQSHIFV